MMNYVYEIDYTVLSKPILKYVEPVKKKKVALPGVLIIASCFWYFQTFRWKSSGLQPALRFCIPNRNRTIYREQNHFFNQLSQKHVWNWLDNWLDHVYRLVISNMGGFHSPWIFDDPDSLSK